MNKTQKFSNKLLTALILVFAGIALLQWGGCKDEPCDGITCKNGGTCVNGLCECPVGYEGADCGQEKVPDNIRIAKITYTKIPLKDDMGNNWDPGGLPSAYPGLYVVVYRDSDPDPNQQNWVAIWNSQSDIGTFNDADPSQVQVFIPSNPVLLSAPEQNYRISLYDEDGNVPNSDPEHDSFVGGISFTPYAPGQSHPAQIIQENSKVRFVLDVTYDF